LARRSDDRGIADRRDLGRVPPRVARRRADAGPERHRRAARRHRASPQWHFADPGQRRGDERLYSHRPPAGDGAALRSAAFRPAKAGAEISAPGCGGAMTRIKINGVDEEVAAVTIAELLAARGIDPAARFLAVAVNGDVVRRANWDAAPLNAGDAV